MSQDVLTTRDFSWRLSLFCQIQTDDDRRFSVKTSLPSFLRTSFDVQISQCTCPTFLIVIMQIPDCNFSICQRMSSCISIGLFKSAFLVSLLNSTHIVTASMTGCGKTSHSWRISCVHLLLNFCTLKAFER